MKEEKAESKEAKLEAKEEKKEKEEAKEKDKAKETREPRLPRMGVVAEDGAALARGALWSPLGWPSSRTAAFQEPRAESDQHLGRISVAFGCPEVRPAPNYGRVEALEGAGPGGHQGGRQRGAFREGPLYVRGQGGGGRVARELAGALPRAHALRGEREAA